MKLKPLIQSDLYRITGKRTGWFGFIRYLYKSDFRYLFIFRLCSHSHQRGGVNYFFLLIYKWLTFRLGYEIPYSVKIGEGLKLVHLGVIVVNPLAEIGDNVTIFKGVVIGSNRRGMRKGAPVIGNEVWIGANAALIGNFTIRNNVMIGPNSYVNIDVPANSIVLGNPCIVKHSDAATQFYIDNEVD